jgi:hypothetical protein
LLRTLPAISQATAALLVLVADARHLLGRRPTAS